MIPIGIVTRNRLAYLDVTLRSLSATRLPADIKLTVFDDASDDLRTFNYLFTDRTINIKHAWPNDVYWDKAGLHIVHEQAVEPVGIRGRVRVLRMAPTSLGVVNGSCRAVSHMFNECPEAPGVILLQDDVIFNVDWYERMLANAGNFGLLAGMRLNRTIKEKPLEPCVISTCATAQCLYISRLAYQRLHASWFVKKHALRQKFDDRLCQAMRKAGLDVGLIYPFVCQHIGMVSLVRPKRGWTRMTKRGRIGYYAHPPYVLAREVRAFH